MIVKASIQVSDNAILVDDKGRRACKVMEMIGPVASPYFSAMPLTDRIEKMIGTKLFLSEERAGPPQSPGSKRRDHGRSGRGRGKSNIRRK